MRSCGPFTCGQTSPTSRKVRNITERGRPAYLFWSVDPTDFDNFEDHTMCRNIKTLANFEPPATDDEVRASALQFVRKLSGTTKPSRVNEAAFNQAVDEVTAAARRLVHSLRTNAPPRNREVEMQKARERSLKRFA